MRRHPALLAGLLLWGVGPLFAQGERDNKVLNDRREIEAAGLWIYNDLARGMKEARRAGKPLLIVFR